MVHATVQRQGGAVRRLLVEGHAGFAPAGQDIVCAAVSAVAQTAVLGLDHVGAGAQVRDADGLLDIELPRQRSSVERRAQDILQTAVLGLRAIRDSYSAYFSLEEGRISPDDHI